MGKKRSDLKAVAGSQLKRMRRSDAMIMDDSQEATS